MLMNNMIMIEEVEELVAPSTATFVAGVGAGLITIGVIALLSS